MEDWERLLSDLYDHLEGRDHRLRLLRDLDHLILERAKKPLDIVCETLSRLVNIIDARSGYLFLHHELQFRFAKEFGQVVALGDVPPVANTIRLDYSTHLKPGNYASVFPWLPADSKSLFIYAIKVEPEVWGLLVLESNRPRQGSKEFVESVLRQISIALQDLRVRSRLEGYEQIHKLFFSTDLDQDGILQIFREYVSRILAEHTEKLLIQIVFYAQLDARNPDEVDPQNEKLLIRWSSNEEEIGALVPLDSFSGCALRSGKPYLLGDPTTSQFTSMYKAFSDFTARTELAIVLRRDPDSDALGVLNLESPNEHAFSLPEVTSLLDLASLVSPILLAVRRRIVMARLNRQVGLYALNTYLHNLRDLYKHKFTSRTEAIRFNLHAASRSAAGELIVKDDLDSVAADFTWMDNSLKELWVALERVASIGPISLLELIEEIEREEQKTAERYLKINKSRLRTLPEVRASRLLKEHLRNLILNSVVSIEAKAQELPGFVGAVEIDGEMVTIRQSREGNEPDPVAELNRRVRITIKDNGKGIPEGNREKVWFPGFSTSGTQGFGLPAARDYAHALNGDLKLESLEGEFCRVWMEIPPFTEPAETASA